MTSRRTFLRSAGIAVAGSTLAPMLSMRAAHGQNIPSDYPSDYADIVKRARAEGRLVVHSNMSSPNWKDVLKAFGERYPDIRIDMLDLEGNDCITRYLAERATGVNSADLIVTAAQVGWIDMNKRGEILDYQSPEAAAWPAWSKPFNGLYTLSADPLVFAWNKTKVPEADSPWTFAKFADMAESKKDAWKNRITTYNPSHGVFGYMAHWFFVNHHGEAAGWKMLEQLARVPPRFETSGGPMIEKVANGEYLNAYFVSAIQVRPRLMDPVVKRFLHSSFIADGQPMMMRGIGITKGAKNVNAAKVLLDFCLSAEGQKAFGRGGVTPARPDVQPSEAVPFTYSSIAEAVGEKNLILIDYNERQITDRKAFLDRFKQVFQS